MKGGNFHFHATIGVLVLFYSILLVFKIHCVQRLSSIRHISETPHVLGLSVIGSDVKQTLVYDRIGEELRTFCANHSIDEVRVEAEVS